MSVSIHRLSDRRSSAGAIAAMVFGEWPLLYPAWGQHSAADVEEYLLRDNCGASFPFTLVALDDTTGEALGTVGLEESDLVPPDERR